MIHYFVFAVIIIYFLIASYEDIKKREVYDYLNYSLTFFILITSIFHSILIESFDPIKYVTFGLLVGFALGSFLYYIGVWGGGDAKFLLGFSASSYYLMNFVNSSTSNLSIVYDMMLNSLSRFFDFFLKTFIDYILFFNIVIMLFILFRFFISNSKEDRKDLISLFLIIFLLNLGLNFDYDSIYLAILGFFSFVLIFFADERILYQVYLLYPKKSNNLKEGDRLNEEIKYKNLVIVSKEDSILGLTKENIHLIEEYKLKRKVNVLKTFPVSTLIVLNFILYIFKIISIDSLNLEILSFQFKFLFFSFLIGGILAILIIFYYYIKNYNKIKLNLSKLEISLLSFLFIITLISSYFLFQILYLLVLIIIYLFLKIAKQVESYMFVSDKSVNDIVPGDWIVEDIKVNDKVLYSVSDFKLGVSETQLDRIKSLAEIKSVLVKDGIAFLPPLFLGFIIILLI